MLLSWFCRGRLARRGASRGCSFQGRAFSSSRVATEGKGRGGKEGLLSENRGSFPSSVLYYFLLCGTNSLLLLPCTYVCSSLSLVPIFFEANVRLEQKKRRRRRKGKIGVEHKVFGGARAVSVEEDKHQWRISESKRRVRGRPRYCSLCSLFRFIWQRVLESVGKSLKTPKYFIFSSPTQLIPHLLFNGCMYFLRHCERSVRFVTMRPEHSILLANSSAIF